MDKGRILIAALDWGLGHASRCVPLVRKYLSEGNKVVLASAGHSYEFFKSQFPDLTVLYKPAYNIKYDPKGNLIGALIKQSTSILHSMIGEHRWLKKVIKEYKFDKVISDNCYGLYHKGVHTIFITHQLNVIAPPNKILAAKLANLFIKRRLERFDEIWIPDYASPTDNLSGKLSHLEKMPRHAKFIGPLSRFSKKEKPTPGKSYDVVVLLSGPEPQRTMLEERCLALLQDSGLQCCFIRGLPGSHQLPENTNNISWFIHLPDDELQNILISAGRIICRSGYSTIMDLVSLNLSALLIPTPGQTEQEYLALHNKSRFESVRQEELTKGVLLGNKAVSY